MTLRRGLAVLLAGLLLGAPARAEVSQLNIPLGAGGFGFLPMMMMQKYQLVEKRAREAGLSLTVNWANVGGPAAMNDALLSGSAQFVPTGPPGFLTLWDRSRGAVRGVAAISAMPMYLNTRTGSVRTVDDLKAGEKIAVTSVKVSIRRSSCRWMRAAASAPPRPSASTPRPSAWGTRMRSRPCSPGPSQRTSPPRRSTSAS